MESMAWVGSVHEQFSLSPLVPPVCLFAPCFARFPLLMLLLSESLSLHHINSYSQQLHSS